MTRDADAFTTYWLYDVGQHLKRHRDYLQENLLYADEEAAKRIISEIEEVNAWLNPAPEPVAPEVTLGKIREVLDDSSVLPPKRIEAIRRLSQSTGRLPRRPKNNTQQYAMRALTLQRATGKPLREITLQVKGCGHPHPKGKSCEKCKEAMRNAIFRLQKLLNRIDYHPPFPSHKELEAMSEAQLDQLWNAVDKSAK